MRTALTSTLLALLPLLVVAEFATAQEEAPIDGGSATMAEKPDGSGPVQRPRSTDLVFEREVFDYPQFTRRNPFVALVASEGGPRFEQIQLRGVIYSDDPGESVALLGIGTLNDQVGPTQAAPSSGTSRSRRVRVGGTWGNVRVLEIRRTEILVEVEEFGLTEQRTMRMPPRGQGD
jgi:hypothetical protein